MQKIVGVKRKNDRDTYFFVQPFELALGDKVVVEFDDFETVAEVTKLGLEEHEDKAHELKTIKRKATEQDLSKFESLAKKAKAKLPEIKAKSLSLGLMMKFISAEISLDESKVLIVFSSEERVDFRQLLKELAAMFRARIELRQIGQRDEVKVCGGVGPCGQPCCCARFLKNFDHVTVKMAKVQGLSLSPTKINGVCGRLMCCLGYESKMYEDMLEKMPKLGSVIKTPNGLGTVVYNDILRERVSLKRQSGEDSYIVEDYSLEEIEDFKKGKFDKKKFEKQEEDAFENKNVHRQQIQAQPEEKPKNAESNFNGKTEKINNQRETLGTEKKQTNPKTKYGISFESDAPEVIFSGDKAQKANANGESVENASKTSGNNGFENKKHKQFHHKKHFSNSNSTKAE